MTKEQFLADAKIVFQGSNVNITAHGRPGAAIGSSDSVKQFVSSKINEWDMQLRNLAKIAIAQP